ncbi:MAG: TadE/TadG family type IV pilus assembly protein, partial [Candidatus Gastranaerophilales bacterium]|nr:TadE/TadG family type IV pilus assembly protein [Candidatus Gastranaerophilales bacterium]
MLKKYSNFHTAQQLVEFVMVLPIIVTAIMIIIEIGFTLNARMTLSESVKMSLTKLNQLYMQASVDETTKIGNIESELENFIKDYFDDHNLPNSDTIQVNITKISGSNTSLITAVYQYSPAFTLPNILGSRLIPEYYTLSSAQSINTVLLEENNFSSTLSTKDLSSFGKSTTSYDPRTSLIKNTNISGIAPTEIKKHIAFLVGFISNYDYAKLVNWYGQDLLPPNLRINIDTGYLEVKSPYFNSGNWLDTKIPYTHVLTSLGFSQAIYAKMDDLSNWPSTKLDLTSSNSSENLGIKWCNQPGYGDCDDDISDSEIDNLNKRGLSFLFGSLAKGYGSLDNITLLNTGSITN